MLIKSCCVVEFRFLYIPHIKGFFHQQHTGLIAGLQKSFGGRLMRDAHSIETRLLQTLNAPFF